MIYYKNMKNELSTKILLDASYSQKTNWFLLQTTILFQAIMSDPFHVENAFRSLNGIETERWYQYKMRFSVQLYIYM